MKARVTDHARMRLLERYGFRLPEWALSEIVTACRTGKAACLAISGEALDFIVRWEGRALVVRMDVDKSHIITFLPPDHFSKGARLRRMLTRNTAKQKSKKMPWAENPDYSRARHKRGGRDSELEAE